MRELRNVVEQAAVLASGPKIEEADLRLEEPRAAPAPPLRTGSFADAKRAAIDDFERTFLVTALERHGGNVSRTAEAIGMVRQSLQVKIRELGLRGEEGDLVTHEARAPGGRTES